MASFLQIELENSRRIENSRSYIQVDLLNEYRPIYDTSSFNLNPSNIYDFSGELRIVRFQHSFKKFKSKPHKKQNHISISSQRSYVLRFNNEKLVISSMCISIIDKNILKEESKTKRFRAKLKLNLYSIIFLFSWIFLFVMITDIYNKYEDNIFKICVSPILSVMVIKFLVTQNIMIFIHTLLMHKFGEQFYMDNRKKFDPFTLAMKYFVPPIAKAHHKSILACSKLIEAIENQKI